MGRRVPWIQPQASQRSGRWSPSSGSRNPFECLAGHLLVAPQQSLLRLQNLKWTQVLTKPGQTQSQKQPKLLTRLIHLKPPLLITGLTWERQLTHSG